MIKLDKDAKICQNCEHFLIHYVANKDMAISRISKGHCKISLKEMSIYKTCPNFTKSTKNQRLAKKIDLLIIADKMSRTLSHLDKKITKFKQDYKKLTKE